MHVHAHAHAHAHTNHHKLLLLNHKALNISSAKHKTQINMCTRARIRKYTNHTNQNHTHKAYTKHTNHTERENTSTRTKHTLKAHIQKHTYKSTHANIQSTFTKQLYMHTHTRTHTHTHKNSSASLACDPKPIFVVTIAGPCTVQLESSPTWKSISGPWMCFRWDTPHNACI